MDFIIGLPISEGYTNLIIIINRLGKGILLEPIRIIKVKDVIRVFL